jgi:hypothetical protein
VVSQLAGADAALASERSYVLHTLPRGVLAGIGDAVRGDRPGAARSWAIVEGAALTVVSYLLARARLARGRSRPAGA